jgi:hypothetical protein
MHDLTDEQIQAKIVLTDEACAEPIKAMMKAIIASAEETHPGNRNLCCNDIWASICYALQMVVCEAFSEVKEFRDCRDPKMFSKWWEALEECTTGHAENGGCRRNGK